MNESLIVPCVKDGHHTQLPLGEAYCLLWSQSIGYIASLHWFRFRLPASWMDSEEDEERSRKRRRAFPIDDGPRDCLSEHEWAGYLDGRVSKAGWEFGMMLMGRGRLALTLPDAQRLYGDDLLDTQWFQARAARYGKAYLGVPPNGRPYRYLHVPLVTRQLVPAYQMRPGVNWILIFQPKDSPDLVDWEELLVPPIGVAQLVSQPIDSKS